MINLKTTRELRYMRDAGKISQDALLKAGEAVRPGVSTLELDKIVRRTIEKAGAVPSFLGYGGFPASACISVNNVVIHGIPQHTKFSKRATSSPLTLAQSMRDSTETTHGPSRAARFPKKHRS